MGGARSGHGGVPSDDDAIAPARLTGTLDAAGWAIESVDDAEERFLALAVRHTAAERRC